MAVAALSGYLAEGLRRAGAQLQRASTQLADLQAFNQHVIDSLMSGLATTRHAGRILTFNRAAEVDHRHSGDRRVRPDAAEVLQLPKSYTTLFGPSEAPAAAAPDRVRLHAQGRQADRDGHQHRAADHAARRDRVPVHVPGRHRVTKRDREARVQQRLAAVGEMAAGIAHEIRNPLASMSGSIQILREELPLTDEQAQLMDIVLRESERLNETIRSFLAFARPQRQAMTAHRRAPGDHRHGALLQNNAERSEMHKIAVDVPGEPVLLQADEAQIRQIVWNLATNGLRAMPDGGWLTLAAKSPTDAEPHVVISVVGRRRRHRAGGARRHLPAVSRRVRPRHRPRPVDRAPDRQRLWRRSARDLEARSGTTVFVKFPAAVAAAVQ